MTYIKIKYELQKEHIAMILHDCILRRYYDVQEELVAVIDKYEQKYQRYMSALKNRNSSIHESEEDITPVRESPVNESRLYASKSVVIGDSTTSPTKNPKSQPSKTYKPSRADSLNSKPLPKKTLNNETSFNKKKT